MVLLLNFQNINFFNVKVIKFFLAFELYNPNIHNTRTNFKKN